MGLSAPDILKNAAQHMENRAATRDQAGGERSMARTVDAFNAITGHEVSERDGWLFMAVLKAARACTTPTGIADDYEDGAAYFGLAGEAAERQRKDEEELDALLGVPTAAPKEIDRYVTTYDEKTLLLPEGYRYAAQDGDGDWCAYATRPERDDVQWSESISSGSSPSPITIGHSEPLEWRESLIGLPA
ncbi:MAG TPA: DUF6378 domain-containing protein [Pyrinomonadaceae bacterium]|nr:DUF6378 domain-containing protein [Pyrinomonadaceae bacterium]